jgi:hypothetical protein
MASVAHAVFACNTDRLSQKQYSRQVHWQLPSIGRHCRKTRSGATMAWGQLLFSPSVQPTLWSYQSNCKTKITQGKNRKVQKGTAASGATLNMPTSYMDSSESGDEEEEHQPTICAGVRPNGIRLALHENSGAISKARAIPSGLLWPTCAMSFLQKVYADF